jgi:biopolymer transport protein ExbD
VALGKLPDAAGDADATEAGDDIGAIFADINITPLTDVFLVLLIIVMVFAVTKVEQEKRQLVQAQRSGYKVDLPEGAAKEIDVTSNSLVVGILVDGTIVVNGQPVAETDLDAIFESAAKKDADTQVVLKADGAVAHRRVVGVMERAKRAKLKRLAIATKGGAAPLP